MKIAPSTAALANLNHWRAGQGAKIGANRPPEVFKACEHIARTLAATRDPLILTSAEIERAIQSAISLERRRIHGLPGKNPDEWRDQIYGIAAKWKIHTKREDWETTTKTGTHAGQEQESP